MPGWGTYPYGTSPWAGVASGPIEVSETVAISENLDIVLPLRLLAATSLTPYLIQLDFSHALNYGFAAILDPANYNIVPSLTIVSVSSQSPNSVILSTEEQDPVIYTITVDQAESSSGDTIDAGSKTAVSAGFGATPTFFAAAQSRRKIQLVFSEEMEQNSDLTNVSSYLVTDLNLTAVSIDSVETYGPTPVQRVTLSLGADLDPGGYYVVWVTSLNIKTSGGLNLSPTYDMFQWGEMQAPVFSAPLSIDISRFSGEVSGGLLGEPLGQVFFSPALGAAIADSSIQVDSVSCCTRAYDVYTMPSLPDPQPLATWGADQAYSSLIGSSDSVLWAPADRLGLARTDLSDFQEETMPQAVDGPADATLQETFDQSRVSLLNVDDWGLYDGVVTSFKTADNLTPIPAGTTTNVNLQP